MVTKVSEEHQEEMLHILGEIHSALKDKSGNTNSNKISVIEIGWLFAINNILNKIDESLATRAMAI